MISETVVHRSQGGGAAGATDADPITTEIVRRGLNSAAEQMKRALIRTAFSPVIYEMLDFVVAIYDRQVRLLAQAPTLPLFMGTMNFCVEAAVEAVGGEEALEPGDILFYNWPFGSGSHPNDMVRDGQGPLARHRRQGPVLDRHGRRLPGGRDLPRGQALLPRRAGAGRLPNRAGQLPAPEGRLR